MGEISMNVLVISEVGQFVSQLKKVDWADIL